jgi:uncharacterized membrane-anchored protein
MDEIIHERDGRRGAFLIRRDGSVLAQMTHSVGGVIAIIDHTDLDRVSAEELIESGVRVVVNVAPSQTGRFPNPGPLLLVRGGVRLIEAQNRVSPGGASFRIRTSGLPDQIICWISIKSAGATSVGRPAQSVW